MSPADSPKVDTQDPKYQADKNYPPDKEETWPYAAAEDGWVKAHNGIRYELRSFAKAMDAIGSETSLAVWQRHTISIWWEGHEHNMRFHLAKRTSRWRNPFLRTRIAFPEKLEADHRQTHVLMAQHIETLRGVVEAIASGDSSTVGELSEAWHKYIAVVEPHLLEEETVGIPLMRAYFTPKEAQALRQKILKRSTKVDTGGFVHAMGSKADAKRFMTQAGIPSFEWYLVYKPARTAYRKRMQSHVDSLLQGRPVVSLHRSKQEKALGEIKRLGDSAWVGAAENGLVLDLVPDAEDVEPSLKRSALPPRIVSQVKLTTLPSSPTQSAQRMSQLKLTSLPGSPTRRAERMPLSPKRPKGKTNMYTPVIDDTDDDVFGSRNWRWGM